MDFSPFPMNHTSLFIVANTVLYFCANKWVFARHGRSLEREKEAEE